MGGPASGVLHVTSESLQRTAQHVADLEHDLEHEHTELCAYRAALDVILLATEHAAVVRATTGVPASDVLRDLIDTICHAAPVPSEPGRPAMSAHPTRARTFDHGPRDGVTEPLPGRANTYLSPDGTPIRERSIEWTVGADGITHYADVYGRECGTLAGAQSIRYIWCGQAATCESSSDRQLATSGRSAVA